MFRAFRLRRDLARSAFNLQLEPCEDESTVRFASLSLSLFLFSSFSREFYALLGGLVCSQRDDILIARMPRTTCVCICELNGIKLSFLPRPCSPSPCCLSLSLSLSLFRYLPHSLLTHRYLSFFFVTHAPALSIAL